MKKLDSVKKPYPFVYKIILLTICVSLAIFIVVTSLLVSSYFTNDKTNISNDLIVPLLRTFFVVFPIDGILLFVLATLLFVRRLVKKNVLIKKVSSIIDLSRTNYLLIDEKEVLLSKESSIKEIVPLGKENENEIIDIVGSMVSSVNDDNPVISAIQHLSYIPLFVNQETTIDNSNYYATYKEDKYVLGQMNNFGYKSEEFVKTKAEPYLLKGYEILLIGKYVFDKKSGKYAEFADIFGLIVVKNEIAQDIKNAILYFQNKGAKIKLLTSSSPFAISEIGKNIGVKNAEKYLNVRDDSPLVEESINSCAVFGGLNKERKEQLVSLLQSKSNVVTTLSADGVIANSNCSISIKDNDDADVNVNTKDESIIALDKESSLYVKKIKRVFLIMFYRLLFSSFFIIAASITSLIGHQYDYRSMGLGIVVSVVFSIILLFIDDDDKPLNKLFYKLLSISILSLLLVSSLFVLYYLQLNQVLYTGINTIQTCYSMCGVIFVLLIPFILLSMELPINKRRVLPIVIMVVTLIVGLIIIWCLSIYLSRGIIGLHFNLFNGQNNLSIASVVLLFVSIYYVASYLGDNYQKEKTNYEN